ncbi:glycosyltransferase family 9 protein [Bordetella sp. 02P26C-1]|uniref:glycosyltransferase family 9 protein n=1 Tax=Bordetella sp. 02P26C-1 TaxID=2683195 RepID=UPI0013546C37|nr:glycosyltransferase family 9 protein [Bordetella sp. 02P26C-1]MVW78650.1 lipopolysaccharide heptosyltransferase family protein [Bordetella sp. 02P26C-1]
MQEIAVYIRSRCKFGDQVVSYATLSQLKHWWPQARLRVVAQHAVSHYYCSLPWVDEFVQAETLVEAVRAMPPRADLAVSLHHTSERYALVNLLRRPKLRLGFRNLRLLDCCWTHAHDKDINEYIALANLLLLNTYRPVAPEEASRRCFEQIAAQAVPQPAPADIVMIPGGGDGEFKRWGVANFLALADSLKSRLGGDARFSFVLGPAEAAEVGALQALRRPDFELIVGRSIPELASLMLNARLVVANDCGPSHIGQGVCVPYVGVFNEANPEWFWARPYSAAVYPENGVVDIQRVSPARVADACLRVLSSVRPY